MPFAIILLTKLLLAYFIHLVKHLNVIGNIKSLAFTEFCYPLRIESISNYPSLLQLESDEGFRLSSKYVLVKIPKFCPGGRRKVNF